MQIKFIFILIIYLLLLIFLNKSINVTKILLITYLQIYNMKKVKIILLYNYNISKKLQNMFVTLLKN